MTLLRLTPWQVLAVAGGGTAVVAVLYLLRVRRRRALVPFAPLWEEVLAAEQRANPLRRLRRLISFLLQATFVVLLAFAIAEPRLGKAGRPTRIVIVLDTSASMQAVTADRSNRFRQAVARAERIVRAMRDGDQVMVLAMAFEPRIVARWSSDQRALLAALRGLTPGDTAAHPGAALRLAAEAVRDEPDARVIVLTDGAVSPPEELDANRLSVLTFGAPADNLAITAFDARPSAADPLRHEVYLEVTAFADRPVKGTVSVYAGEARDPVEVVPLTVEPDTPWRRVIRGDVASISPGPLRAELAAVDALPADNRAYAFLPPPPGLTVDLVADTPDFFLLKAIEAHPAVTVRTTPPDAWRPAAGVVPIFLNSAPDTPPAGPAIFIDPPADRSPVPIDRTVRMQPITELADHPLSRQVRLLDLDLPQASAFRVRPADRVLARCLDAPVLVTARRGSARMLLIGFQPSSSDLPLRTAFPILVANALDWARGAAAAADRRAFRVGEPVEVALDSPAENARVQLVRPGAGPAPVPASLIDGAARFIPHLTGFYHVSDQDNARTVAVNTIDLRECDLRGASSAPVTDTAAQPEPVAPAAALWPILLWAAVVLTAVEWFTYHRRWTV